jgi:hypothetical protein
LSRCALWGRNGLLLGTSKFSLKQSRELPARFAAGGGADARPDFDWDRPDGMTRVY